MLALRGVAYLAPSCHDAALLGMLGFLVGKMRMTVALLLALSALSGSELDSRFSFSQLAKSDSQARRTFY